MLNFRFLYARFNFRAFYVISMELDSHGRETKVLIGEITKITSQKELLFPAE